MAFIKYMRGGPIYCGPRITLTHNAINVNGLAVKKLGLSDMKFVEIGYDKDEDVIGIFPCQKKTASALLVQWQKCDACRITVGGFLKAFDLEGKCYQVLSAEKMKNGDIHISFTGEKINRKVGTPKKKKQSPIRDENPISEQETLKNKSPKLIDYECAECGNTNVAWKYAASLKSIGHPQRCVKCKSSHFVPIPERSKF